MQILVKRVPILDANRPIGRNAVPMCEHLMATAQAVNTQAQGMPQGALIEPRLGMDGG